jgi:beta-phosphoglucomutase
MAKWPVAVLFDFDGVIVNSEPLHLQAFQEILALEKIDLTEEEYYRELIGFDDRGAFRHVYESRGRVLDPKTFLRVMTNKLERMMGLIEQRRYKALPGVEEFVRGLWRHYPLAIVSGARREEIEAMLLGVSLRDCFSTIVAAEDVKVGKPDPEGYLLATRLIGEKSGKAIAPADCLVIEDAPSVARRARAVGFIVLGVATSYPTEKLGDCQYIVHSLRPAEVAGKIPHLKLAV